MIVLSQQWWGWVGGRVIFLSDLANDAKNMPQHHFGFSNVTNHNWSIFCTHVKKKTTSLQKILTVLGNSLRSFPHLLLKRILRDRFHFKIPNCMKTFFKKVSFILEYSGIMVVVVRSNETREWHSPVSPGCWVTEQSFQRWTDSFISHSSSWEVLKMYIIL